MACVFLLLLLLLLLSLSALCCSLQWPSLATQTPFRPPRAAALAGQEAKLAPPDARSLAASQRKPILNAPKSYKLRPTTIKLLNQAQAAQWRNQWTRYNERQIALCILFASRSSWNLPLVWPVCVLARAKPVSPFGGSQDWGASIGLDPDGRVFCAQLKWWTHEENWARFGQPIKSGGGHKLYASRSLAPPVGLLSSPLLPFRSRVRAASLRPQPEANNNGEQIFNIWNHIIK